MNKEASSDCPVFVYRITCLVSGKSYIGVTRRLMSVRWAEHIKNAQKNIRHGALQGAIRKHGHGSFKIEVLYEAVNEMEARSVERSAIATYGTIWPSGYNMSTGGEQFGRHRLTPETKAKMSAAAVGRKISVRQRQLASENTKRLWADPEYRKRVLASRDTDEQRLRTAQFVELVADNRRGKPGFFKGKKHTEESKQKMSLAQTGRPAHNKGVPMPAHQKLLLVSIHTGRKQSEKEKEKHRTTMNDPRIKSANRERMLARWSDPVARSKMLGNRPCYQRNQATAAVRGMISELPTEYVARPSWD